MTSVRDYGIKWTFDFVDANNQPLEIVEGSEVEIVIQLGDEITTISGEIEDYENGVGSVVIGADVLEESGLLRADVRVKGDGFQLTGKEQIRETVRKQLDSESD